MKAEELRLGNFIEQGKVFEVKPYHVRVSYWHHHKQQDAMSLVKLDECEPIPLSEEVLLKCGFDLKSVPYHAIKGNIVLVISNGIWYYKFSYTKVQYLHQLQNLFYSLTQTELEVSL